MAPIAAIALIVALYGVAGVAAYVVVRYAVKHGVRDALKERDIGNGGPAPRPFFEQAHQRNALKRVRNGRLDGAR